MRFSRKKPMLEAGSEAPAFELQELNGGRRSLQAILERGPALFAFFKSSCPVCQLTLPFLDRMADSPTMQVIAISQDDAETTRAFQRRFGVSRQPILFDEAKAGYPASNAFGISSVPSLFVVEQDGKISKAFSGFSKRDIEALGERMGVAPFRPDDNVPEWKAG
jgi:peroxiredoxin